MTSDMALQYTSLYSSEHAIRGPASGRRSLVHDGNLVPLSAKQIALLELYT